MQTSFYQNINPSFYEGWHPRNQPILVDSIPIRVSPFSGDLLDIKETFVDLPPVESKAIENRATAKSSKRV